MNNKPTPGTPQIEQLTTQLNCTYTYSDADNQSMNADYYDWWVNGTRLNINSQLLGNGNYSDNNNVTCQVIVNDGIENSTATNSSVYVLGDMTPPSIGDVSVPETAYTDTPSTISLTCMDANPLAIGYPRFSFTDPNGQLVGNLTMTCDGSSCTRSYTFNTVGVYDNFKFYCKDGTGNMASDLTNIYQVASARPPASAGGGGGGGGFTTTIDKGNATYILDFGTSRITFTRAFLPEEAMTVEKELRVRNRGTASFDGTWKPSSSLKGKVDVDFCTISRTGCSDELHLAAGESGMAVFKAEVSPGMGAGYEGVIRLVPEDDDDQVIELDLVVDRLPGYSVWGPLEEHGIPGPISILIMFGLLGGLAYAAATGRLIG